MSEGKRRALEYICQHYFTLQFILYGGVIALFLEIAALLTLDPSSASYTVAVINLPGLLLFMLFAIYFLRKCVSYD